MQESKLNFFGQRRKSLEDERSFGESSIEKEQEKYKK